jgi:hypothetical protein
MTQHPPEIIIRLRKRIEIIPPEEQRFAVLHDYELELLVNLVAGYESALEKARSETIEIHRRYHTAAELVSKLAGDKRVIMRERDDARQAWCIAMAKHRRCQPAEVARGERWNYLFKEGTRP